MEIILAVTIIVLAVFLYIKLGRGKKIGPRFVKSMLKNLGDGYAVFSDVVVSTQHGMGCIDFVVVSTYGVFVIDTKLEEGKISGEIGEREWNVGKKQTIYNPIWRNRTNVNGLEKLLGQLRYVSLVVFLNGKLKSDFGANVVEVTGMLPLIKQYQRKNLKPEKRKAIIKILEKKQTKE